MKYALVKNGAVAAYPYSFTKLRADNPGVSFPAESGPWLANYDVVEVATTPRPVDTLTTNFVEGAPALSNGVWAQVWTEVPASAEEIQQRAEAAAQGEELDASKLDEWIVSYLNMTPAQAERYVLDNVTNLNTAKSVMSKLAYAVRVLIRREFNR